MRSPRSLARARCRAVAAALVSTAVALASSAAAQDGSPCVQPTEISTILALTRTNAPGVTNAPTTNNGGVAVDVTPTRTDRRTEVCINREQAPKTLAPQAGIVVVATTGFTGAVLSRLDGARGQTAAPGPLAPDGPMGLGHGQKAQPPASPLTVYAMGTLQGGGRSDLPNSVGFDYGAVSGTAGIEYAVNRNLIVGLAANYTATNADLHSGATIDVTAVQLAGYMSYATKEWFVDALAALGSQDVDMVRPGVVDPVRGSTGGSSMALAARAGYLFDFGSLRAGPIAGLTYVRTRIDGYTETGDPQLTFTVSSQTLDSLTGSIGIRLLTSFQAGGNLVVPYLNITWEHQFGDNSRVLTASLAQVPALPPILSAIPNFDTRDFGKIEGGLTVQLGPDLSASVSGASTFARDESYDFRLSAGLNLKF